MYLQLSETWYFGLSESIKSMVCRNGYHQGDVLATWLYIMTIQPRLQKIKDHIVAEFGAEMIAHVKFFVDDGNFMPLIM
jgi:hypothetical protein